MSSSIRPMIAIGATLLVVAIGVAVIVKNAANPVLVAAPATPPTEAKPEPQPVPKPEPKAELKPEAKPAPKPIQAPAPETLLHAPGTKAGKSDLVMFGGTPGRNMINTIDKNIPDKPDPNDDKVLKWKADLGSLSYGGPTIANGKVYIPTFSGKLNVYGLLESGARPKPAAAPVPTPTTAATAEMPALPVVTTP